MSNIIVFPDGIGNKTTTARVSFFMRNGADCLSKWVGEAERTLRQTFEVAKQHQPSIIFFDEIDGLAPVRSSRQDQIHSSIVSTLLGLMDGLEARGQIVVIGATNRVDSIDPALRRAGRFDRELIFKLPNLVARKTIMGIHTRKWDPKPSDTLLDDIAARTVGYCGADLKSLCSESALSALRRRYGSLSICKWGKTGLGEEKGLKGVRKCSDRGGKRDKDRFWVGRKAGGHEIRACFLLFSVPLCINYFSTRYGGL